MPEKRKALLFFIAVISSIFFCQAQIDKPAIEGWRVHLPFGNDNSLCESGYKIFVGSPSGVFTYNELDNSFEILSRVNGLSDVEVKTLASDPVTKDVIIVYTDANIDIIEGNNIYNISDIFSQVIIGDKTINNISFYQNKAYLSCSFGIAIIDIKKKIIIDSYSNLGANGSTLNILDTEIFGDTIYASTPNGIYVASLQSFNLSDYHSWSMLLPSAKSSLLATFNHKLYAVIDSTIQVSTDGKTFSNFSPFTQNPLSININQGKLIISTLNAVIYEDATGNIHNTTTNSIYGALLANNDQLFTIGYYTGLMKNNADGSVAEYYSPQGPYAKTASRMAYNFSDNSLWIAGGSIGGFATSSGWAGLYNNSKFYRYDDYWYNYNNTGNVQIENARDFIDVTVNTKTNHAFLSTLGHGLFEIEPSPFKATVYDTTNSTLKPFIGKSIWIGGTCLDKNQNLWVSNFGALNPISERLANGNWLSYSLPSAIDGKQTDNALGFITTDDNNYKWIISTKGSGIYVFNENGDANHSYRLLQKDIKKGGMPSNTVIACTKDHKGEMWVGTDQGLCIFSNTGNIFRDSANYDSHQIVIKTGLVFSNFLGSEAIYCIRVDDANRKWIGTKNGVWLVSADGYTVIKNFTQSNSPLLSNAVYDIAINQRSGEVFFATEKGIISYMGTATLGGDAHEGTIIYPNPVRPDYHGLIVIRGLSSNAVVKITDIAGNLVYETTANGGMATWTGMNFQGKRAATGVYIVYTSNQDATDTWAGKILFIN